MAKKKRPSRADRRDEACSSLAEAIQKAEAVRDAIKLVLDAQPDGVEELPAEARVSEEAADGQPAAANPADHWISEVEDVAAAVEDAVSSLEDLKDEMESWRDNTPESLQGTEKYEAVSEAADTLETAIDSGQENDLNDVAAKLASATSYLELCEAHDDLDEAIDSFQNCHDEAESVEFPGMFG